MNLNKLNELKARRAVHPRLKLSIRFVGVEVEQKLLVSLVVNDPLGKLFGLVVTRAFVSHQCCHVCNFLAKVKLTLGSKTLATWKCAKSSTRIDTKALAQAHPDIASEFSSTVMGSRRFLLKDAS